MKKGLWVAALLALGLCGLLSVSGCKKSQPGGQKAESPSAEPPKANLVSAEKTSFQEVTSHLDPGGSVYVYLSTEQWLAGVSAKMAGVRGVLGSLPNFPADDRQNLEKGFDLATHLVKDSGIEDVSGFGMSAIAWEKDFYRGKALVHHYPGKGHGFLWTMFGQKPHPMDALDMLPSTTALASFSDLDLTTLWEVVQKEVAQSNFPQAQEVLKQLPVQFEKATGLEWDKVLASLGGQFGLVLTLDETRRISLPIPSPQPLDIPEPGLMLVAKVKDDTIFNRLDEALEKTGQQIVSVDKPDLKMRTLPIPLPLPIQLRPSVALSQGYLFIATTDGLIQEVLAVKAGKKPGLKSTSEFQRLAKEMPAQGNSLTYLSQSLGKTFHQLQQQALEMHANQAGGNTEWIEALLGTNQMAFSYSVSANTDEGWLMVANASQNPAKFMLAPVVIVPVAVIAGVAIPNFMKARERAQGAQGASQPNACIANLNQIAAAKQKWALEHNKTEADTPMRSELLPYLPNQQFPACPSGGTYTMNPIGTPPECSVPGHQLPTNEK